MSELIIYQNQKKVFRIPLDAERFSIGRSSHNDLILTGATVSRNHAILERRQGGFWLQDQSSAGTLIGGKSIAKPILLKDNDEIVISQWNLVFKDKTPLFEIESENRETQITEIRRELTPDSTKILQLFDSKKVRSFKPIIFVQDAVSGQRKEVVHKKSLVVGSDPSCDIVLQDDFVSKFHLELKQSDRGFHVIDLNSTNGTFVGGMRIQDSYVQDSQDIGLGHSKIFLHFDQVNEEAIEPYPDSQFCGIYGSSHGMRMLFSKMKMVASSDMTCLVQGESGTGKEMVARALHDLSQRSEKPYVVINCGAIARHLIESELFGHEKGAFTGAEQKHIGAFEQANGGTLFLDEIGELPLDLQAKLLRVLEYQTLRRVGGKEEIKLDFRLVAATHRDLATMMAKEVFREDLFYRLYVLPLVVPALRERKEDVPQLVNFFLNQFAEQNLVFDPQAVQKLIDHSWPGNVRELKNTVLRSVAFAQTSVISCDDVDIIQMPLIKNTNKKNADKDLIPEDVLDDQAKQDFEKKRISEALKSSHGDKRKAAQILGMGRSTLFRKIKDYGLDIDLSLDS